MDHLRDEHAALVTIKYNCANEVAKNKATSLRGCPAISPTRAAPSAAPLHRYEDKAAENVRRRVRMDFEPTLLEQRAQTFVRSIKLRHAPIEDGAEPI